MVFVNGDNNLQNAAIDDFGEMAQVGSNDTLNVVVQLDQRGKGDTKRYLVGKDDTVGSDPVQTLSEQNMGDPNVLEDFIVWAVKNYKADHYILVIWDHGDGWRTDRLQIAELEATQRAEGAGASPGMKAVSHDEYDGDVLYMHEVGQALAKAQNTTGVRLDIVGFDACLMGMIEVAYEIRNSADFMVASEETEPGDGWPYDTILEDMVDLSESRIPSKLAEIIVRRYGEFYGSNGDRTQAAYDLHKIPAVVDALGYFVRTHNDLPEDDKEWPRIGDARPEVEEFHDNCVWCCPDQCWGVDLGDLAKEVGTRVENDDIQEGLLGLQVAIGTSLTGSGFVIANFHGDAHPDAYGVAIYFPPDHGTFLADDDHDGYKDSNTHYPVAFVQDLQWDNWLREQYYPQFP